jgi:hypothetical protein
MKNKSPLAFLFAVLVGMAALGAAQTAAAQCVTDRMGATYCPPAGAKCLKDAVGNLKCSSPDGGIIVNRFQEPMCGPGQCVMTPLGETFCSKVAKGYAAINSVGQAECTSGCVAGSAGACVTPTK